MSQPVFSEAGPQHHYINLNQMFSRSHFSSFVNKQGFNRLAQLLKAQSGNPWIISAKILTRQITDRLCPLYWYWYPANPQWMNFREEWQIITTSFIDFGKLETNSCESWNCQHIRGCLLFVCCCQHPCCSKLGFCCSVQIYSCFGCFFFSCSSFSSSLECSKEVCKLSVYPQFNLLSCC